MEEYYRKEVIMGIILLVMFILLLFLCFSIYNWWFLRENNRRIPKSLKGKVPWMRNHIFWGMVSLVSLLVILGITGTALYDLFVNILKMQK